MLLTCLVAIAPRRHNALFAVIFARLRMRNIYRGESLSLSVYFRLRMHETESFPSFRCVMHSNKYYGRPGCDFTLSPVIFLDLDLWLGLIMAPLCRR